MVKQNGEKLWVLVRATVRIEIVSGTPQLLGGVITDISQRKSIEEKLRNSNTELEKAVETKNKFISIISHDLRNQFNAITGLSEILTKRLQDYDDDRNSQMALVINQSSKSAYKLLNDLLTWARSQANSIEFNAKTTHPVIAFLPDHSDEDDLGGTLRLGAYPCKLKAGSLAEKLYGTTEISERHRHRYEVNNEYRADLEKAGMSVCGTSPDGHIVEMIEIPDHPFFIATQAHPELKSRPNRPHPLFAGFVGAAKKHGKA